MRRMESVKTPVALTTMRAGIVEFLAGFRIAGGEPVHVAFGIAQQAEVAGQ